MSTVTVSGTVVDAAGLSHPFAGTITIEGPPVISSVTIVPASAPAGTLRTITIVATDPQGGALTYTCTVPGYSVTQNPTSKNIFTVTV